jgi:hypothetical protein
MGPVEFRINNFSSTLDSKGRESGHLKKRVDSLTIDKKTKIIVQTVKNGPRRAVKTPKQKAQ